MALGPGFFYDIHFKVWSQPPPDDAIIVAIDADSLASLGAWPWPRKLHAELITILAEAGANTIVYDIIFAEPSNANPEGDIALAKALKQSGNVILPVLVEESNAAGNITETLPFSLLAESAAGLGHVHVVLDPDGIARSVFLKVGMQQANWPALSLAALQFKYPEYYPNYPALDLYNGTMQNPIAGYAITISGYRLLGLRKPLTKSHLTGYFGKNLRTISLPIKLSLLAQPPVGWAIHYPRRYRV